MRVFIYILYIYAVASHIRRHYTALLTHLTLLYDYAEHNMLCNYSHAQQLFLQWRFWHKALVTNIIIWSKLQRKKFFFRIIYNAKLAGILTLSILPSHFFAQWKIKIQLKIVLSCVILQSCGFFFFLQCRAKVLKQFTYIHIISSWIMHLNGENESFKEKIVEQKLLTASCFCVWKGIIYKIKEFSRKNEI